MLIRFTRIAVIAIAAALAVSAQTSIADKPLSWAYPMPDPGATASTDSTATKLPGSAKAYTQVQIDDLFAPPDWFPNEHGALPSLVTKGIQAQACGSCHLISGMGHPESSTLAGLPAEYLIRQMRDFKEGTRKDPPGYEASLRTLRMNIIADGVPDDKMLAAIEYFAKLKPLVWYKVVETETVPKSWLNTNRMRLPAPGGGTEPIGDRIVTLPQDPERAEQRDPHSGFIAYVAKGSLKRGEALAKGGDGKTLACATCHGAGLKGLGNVPRLAGMHPSYLVRQLNNMKLGGYSTSAALPMIRVVAKLSDDDIIALAAYAASLEP